MVSEEHTHLGQEMARLREARARFQAERREAEEGLRAVCEEAGVEWTMEPLPTPAEEEALAAAQQAEMEERTSKLEALLTAASAPSAPQGAEPEDIDYDEVDEDDGDQADGMSPAASGPIAAGDGIDYDEEDDEGDTEDDEAGISVAPAGLPDSSTAAGDDLDYDEEDDDDEKEDDEEGTWTARGVQKPRDGISVSAREGSFATSGSRKSSMRAHDSSERGGGEGEGEGGKAAGQGGKGHGRGGAADGGGGGSGE